MSETLSGEPVGNEKGQAGKLVKKLPSRRALWSWQGMLCCKNATLALTHSSPKEDNYQLNRPLSLFIRLPNACIIGVLGPCQTTYPKLSPIQTGPLPILIIVLGAGAARPFSLPRTCALHYPDG